MFLTFRVQAHSFFRHLASNLIVKEEREEDRETHPARTKYSYTYARRAAWQSLHLFRSISRIVV
jgi:hypothetical protein